MNFQAANVLSADYTPSDVDILYAEHVTSSNGLSSVDFSFPLLPDEDKNNDTNDQYDPMRFVQEIMIFTVSENYILTCFNIRFNQVSINKSASTRLWGKL